MTDAPSAESPQHGDAPPAAPRPPLRRSRDHKVISGVCGGLGRFFDLDPVIFRVALGVLAATGGLGLIVYGFAWLLIPLEGEEENEGRRMLSGRVDGPALTAVLCALVGCGLFLSMLNNSGAMSFSLMLTVVLVGTAYWSQKRRVPDADEEPAAVRGAPKQVKAQKTMDAPPETQAPPPLVVQSWWRDPVVQLGPGATPHHHPGYLWGPDDSPYEAYAPAKERAARRVRERDSRQLAGWTSLAALVAFAAGTGPTWNSHPLGTSLEIGLGCALAVYGLGIAVSSRYGRTGGATITMAVLTGLLLTGAAALPKSVTTEWRRETWRPVNAAELRPAYEVGTGEGTLDLTALPWRTGTRPVVTSAEAGAGRLVVVIPEDVTADLTVEVGIGYIKLPQDGRDDVDVKPRQKKHVTVAPPPGHLSRGTLELHLKTAIGEVEVTRAAP
ncbi:PspC domain-containing protein [Streptomyces sp. I05A-00742]|uniref:PspC domain-containing protein n=1 Tax=Streptomyces sp. I05A-00742 TaxID=2732853 RepID=UPI00148819D9|nr:PspC domain-containing protein [Streptomyces sp. I05A-00742]